MTSMVTFISSLSRISPNYWHETLYTSLVTNNTHRLATTSPCSSFLPPSIMALTTTTKPIGENEMSMTAKQRKCKKRGGKCNRGR